MPTSPGRIGRLPRLTAITLLVFDVVGCASSAPARNEAGSDVGNQAAAAAQRCESFRGFLDSVRTSGRAPGISLGVVLPDGSSCGVAVGWADTSRKIPLLSTSLLLTGSVGKTYVSAVVMQLAAEARVELDAPIARYLGNAAWFPRLPNGERITVRQLLNHSSGLVRYEFDSNFVRDLRANPLKIWTPEERIAYLFDRPAPFPAGEGWDYSDTNYIVLGMIVESVTGRSLNDEIARRLLRPLALRSTRPSDSPELPGVANGYAGPGNPFGGFDATITDGRFTINPQLEWAGGGYASTAEDLARWMRDFFAGRAFPDSLVKQATTGVAAPMLGGNVSYGLGVIIRPTPIGVTWGHSGFFPGYNTDARYWPEHRVAVALLWNTSVPGALGRGPGQVLAEIASRILRR